MILTTKGRYAVTAMVHLAGVLPVTTIPLSAITEAASIPLNYLEQLFRKLRCAALVTAERGANGGYCLARPPSHITISEVIRAVEEPLDMTRCHGHMGCIHQGQPCSTHALWDGLSGHILDYLNAITLSDVHGGKALPYFIRASSRASIPSIERA